MGAGTVAPAIATTGAVPCARAISRTRETWASWPIASVPATASASTTGTSSISGERSSTRETKEADYLHREISYGSFTRSLVLPEGVDKDKISAEYRNGMLEITAPIATSALPKKIEIKSLPSSRAASA